MPHRIDLPNRGSVFNAVAETYDRHRPAYPELLIDRALAATGIGAGDAVLEIGCGTGQLTRSLAARGLHVTAVEPGRKLLARARDHLDGIRGLQFVNARLEDAVLPPDHYAAAFSAAAIHWIDPDVSWRKLADALVDGGSIALVSYFGLQDARSSDDQRALRAAMARVAPEQAAEWPVYRDLDGILAGVAARRENVSKAWAWLGGYAIAREHAATLFDDAAIVAVPKLLEHTADQLNALLATMSFWTSLSPSQRRALAAETVALHRRLARPIRSSAVACLLTARRRPRT